MRSLPLTGPWLLVCALAALVPARGADAPRTDVHGDPLPDGALARLGTVRWRADSAVVMTAFLPDGKSVLTVSQDYVAQVWDRDTGKELRHFDAAGPAPTEANAPRLVMLNANSNNVALSADGKTLASPGRDGAVHLWDVAMGKEVAKVGGYLRTIGRWDAGRSDLALSGDGKTLAVAIYGQKTTIWDVPSGKELRSFGDPNGLTDLFRYHLTLSGDGKTLVQSGLVTENGGIKTSVVVWDAANGRAVRRLSDAVLGTVTTATPLPAVSPDAKLLAVPVAAKVKLIDLTTGKEARELGDDDGVGSLTFSPDGKLLIAQGGRNEGFTVWDVAGGKKPRELQVSVGRAAFGSRFGITMSLSPDNKLLAWAEGPTLRLVNLETGTEKIAAAGHGASPRSLLFARDGKTVLTAGDDAVRRWDAVTGKEIGRVALPATSYSFVLSSPDGRLVAAVESTGTVHLTDAVTGKETHALKAAKPPVFGRMAAAFSPDGKLLATAGYLSESVAVYDLTSGQQKHELRLPAADDAAPGGFGEMRGLGPPCVCFSRDNRLLAVVDGAAVVLWDAAGGREERQIKLPQERIPTAPNSMAFSPDARTVAIEMGNGQVDVWEVASGLKRLSLNAQPVARDPPPRRLAGGFRLAPLANPVRLAFSPEGRLLAQVDGAKARLWDVYAGKEVAAYAGHRGSVVTLAFAPDGRRLATASTDTTALLWDAAPALKKLAPLAAPLAKDKLPALWTALGETDAARAFEAVRALAGDPAASVPFVAERVKPVAPPDKAQVAKLIADLDAEEFDVRAAAREELKRLGELALAPMREALKGRPSAEQKRALEELVKGAPTPSADRLRLVRALEALELARTPEAVKVLKAVAAGAPDTLPTTQARAILTRLGEK
jgi:WD40 repeat protein